YALGLKGSYDPFGGRVIFAPSSAYNWTEANTDQDSTGAFTYSLVTSTPLNKELTASVTLKETKTRRNGADTSVSNLVRRDDAFNYALTLSWRKPGPPSALVPTVALTHSETETDSNILNFNTRTRDTNLALTWVF
ncbi:MAG: hypothetical protein VW778_08450, partial [Betaproteobacteria bacterium]